MDATAITHEPNKCCAIDMDHLVSSNKITITMTYKENMSNWHEEFYTRNKSESRNSIVFHNIFFVFSTDVLQNARIVMGHMRMTHTIYK